MIHVQHFAHMKFTNMTCFTDNISNHGIFNNFLAKLKASSRSLAR